MLTTPSGFPGVGNTVFATPKDIYYTKPNENTFIPLPIALSAAAFYNSQNLPYYFLPFAGTFIGRLTGSSLWGQSILGATTVAYTSGGTSLTVSAGTAAALNAVSGGSGTFTLVGPPTTSGSNATTTVTYSAVNTTTNVITISSAGANFIAGSLVCPANGAQNIVSVIANPYGVKLTDWTNINPASQLASEIYLGGMLNSGQLVNYPTNAVLIAYIKSTIRGNGIPDAKFSDDFGF